LLEQYEQLNAQGRAAWMAVGTYSMLVPVLLNSLKSITGKTFTSYVDYRSWWGREGKEFEVLD
tara:strand:- start:133 stop:321 length:189 start_codon:yes stop_codon:yes gene_type:complete